MLFYISYILLDARALSADARLLFLQYSCIDTSPVSVYITSPFWDFLLKVRRSGVSCRFWRHIALPYLPPQFVPLWVAPNLLTLLGGLCTFSILLLLSYYDYDYHTATKTDGIVRPPIPSWVWLYCAAAYFTGYTLDGIDGKQARRLKASSPVGMYISVHSVCLMA